MKIFSSVSITCINWQMCWWRSSFIALISIFIRGKSSFNKPKPIKPQFFPNSFSSIYPECPLVHHLDRNFFASQNMRRQFYFCKATFFFVVVKITLKRSYIPFHSFTLSIDKKVANTWADCLMQIVNILKSRILHCHVFVFDNFSVFDY